MMNLPRSHVPGTIWPAIPEKNGAALLALLFQMETGQWLPAAEIEHRQLRQLEGLLAYCARNVPFYRDRLAGLPGALNGGFSWEAWRSLPLLERNHLIDHQQQLISTAIPPGHGKTCKHVTSGSTGHPVTVYGSEVTAFLWKAFTLREMIWHLRNFMGKFAIIRYDTKIFTAHPGGLSQKEWGGFIGSLYPTGPSSMLDIRVPIPEQAAWLVREQPTYLLTYPSNLLALARHFAETGAKLPTLRQISTLSETLPPEARPICREVFGVEIKDMYSSKDVGYMALQCPEHDHYHVQSEGVLLEVLDGIGQPCRPGETGRIVVTTLHNFVMPLLRYNIGDYAEVGESCPCGRGLPTLKRILGRVRNMLTLPSGEKRWPSFAVRTWAGRLPVRQFQFVQKTLAEIEARLVTDRPLNREEEEWLTGSLQKSFFHPFRIVYHYCEEIPRSGEGKFEDFKSEIESPPAAPDHGNRSIFYMGT